MLLDAADEIGAAVIIATHDPLIAARLPDQWDDARRPAAHPPHRPIDGPRHDHPVAAGAAAPPTRAARSARPPGSPSPSRCWPAWARSWHLPGHHDRPGRAQRGRRLAGRRCSPAPQHGRH